jgi:hypothetical protein
MFFSFTIFYIKKTAKIKKKSNTIQKLQNKSQKFTGIAGMAF